MQTQPWIYALLVYDIYTKSMYIKYIFGETSADAEIPGVLKKAKYYASLVDRWADPSPFVL